MEEVLGRLRDAGGHEIAAVRCDHGGLGANWQRGGEKEEEQKRGEKEAAGRHDVERVGFQRSGYARLKWTGVGLGRIEDGGDDGMMNGADGK